MATKPKLAKSQQTEQAFTVTLIGGTKHTVIGTHLEQTNENTVIWNEQIIVRSYKRSEYEDIQ
jgi:VCBS repeat-containing protein